MTKTSIQTSVEEFENKKRQALAFLDQAIALRQEFDKVFPGDGNDASVAKLQDARQRLSDAKLKILVAGQFKTGKSTLLNAILGSHLLPDDVMPCTAVITEIEYGPEREATLSFKEGINPDALPEGLYSGVEEHLRKYGPHAPDMKVNIDNPDALQDYLVIPVGMEHMHGVRESPYAKCVLKWPLELCRGGAVIIDSPGLNEHETRDATTLAYLSQADMVLHVMSALQPCGMADKKFIIDVAKGGNGSIPLIFALNRFDQLRNDRDKEKMRNYVLNLAEMQGKYGREGIFFTSATNALEARGNGDEKMLRESGLPDLEKMIADVFERDRIAIKLGVVREAAEDIRRFSEHVLGDLQSLLDRDAGQLERELEKTNGEFERLEALLGRIRRKVEVIAERYEKNMEFGIRDFFMLFCEHALPDIVQNTNLPEIGMMTSGRDTKKCVQALNSAVNENMVDALKSWFYGPGSQMEKEAFQEIREEIHANLEDFGEALARLRSTLKLKPLKIDNKAQIDFSDFADDILLGAGVAGAVGAVSAGALFVLERFLPALFGPIGWAVMIVATLVTFIGVLGGADAREKLRKKYLPEAEQALRGQIDSYSREIADMSGKKFRETALQLFIRLQEEIEEARKPLLLAREAQLKHKDELAGKKHALGIFREKFSRLAEEGAAILPENATGENGRKISVKS